MQRRIKPTAPACLEEKAEPLCAQAQAVPHGTERDRLLRKARQAGTAARMQEWLSSSGLQPPD
jgi:hypothetical protein